MKTVLNPNRVGIRVACAICGNQKQPVGRSASPAAYYCNNDCDGYRQEPHIGWLWPGESEMDFGHRVPLDGTRIEARGEQ